MDTLVGLTFQKEWRMSSRTFTDGITQTDVIGLHPSGVWPTQWVILPMKGLPQRSPSQANERAEYR
jgi:hypothetical protein